jgi:hypothetical protein
MVPMRLAGDLSFEEMGEDFDYDFDDVSGLAALRRRLKRRTTIYIRTKYQYLLVGCIPPRIDQPVREPTRAHLHHFCVGRRYKLHSSTKTSWTIKSTRNRGPPAVDGASGLSDSHWVSAGTASPWSTCSSLGNAYCVHHFCVYFQVRCFLICPPQRERFDYLTDATFA